MGCAHLKWLLPQISHRDRRIHGRHAPDALSRVISRKRHEAHPPV
jgi:hypothetical protein